MLHIHHSNRLENLAGNLITSYGEQTAHPFTPRILVCENQSLARWLRQQFCLYDGIACLLDTPLPATWLWNQARKLLDLPFEEDLLSRERMQWLIFAALDKNTTLRTGTQAATVNEYLEDDITGLKRWQLAGRVADCFDRYQYYRPELIRDWSAGKDQQWQAQLWREISSGVDQHRVVLMDQFFERLKHQPDTEKLPPRLDLFSIHNLPKLLLDAYAAIAEYIPVHIWLVAPTPEYWADLATPRQLAQLRLKEPENAPLWQAGNPLLTQWGRQGQAFQDMLLELNALDTDDGRFHEPLRESLLGNLQADIYTAVDTEEDENITTSLSDNNDSSIQIHICHGAMRECQVLRDNILHCLNDDTSLQAEDILVMVPEISRYAPYIDAVFGRSHDKEKQRLPFNISDIVLADEHPLIRAFLTLMELPESRFTRTELMSLINLPEVCRRFNLNQEDHSELAELFDQLAVYWGLDAQHKNQQFNLPAIDDNTWHQSFQRIMAGFALGEGSIYSVAGSNIAPALSINAQNAEHAARFFNLLQALRYWTHELKKPATASEWVERLSRLLDAIFDDSADEDDRLTHIRTMLSELEAMQDIFQQPAPGSTELSAEVIRHWLNNTLATRTENGQFYSGGITFCGMQPLRGVPFKVICLLGMHDQAFPHRRHGVEFDAMHMHWRHGDPDIALEDRYLFLETLLATRERLIISYTGRHSRSNEVLQPSVVVQELLDYIDERYRIDGRAPSKIISRVHPLQPFGRGNYDSTINRPGFDTFWLDTARDIMRHEPPQRVSQWPDINTPPSDNPGYQITTQELTRFFSHPIRHFVQQQLHVYDPRDIELIEEEPFELNGLERWQIKDQLLEYWLQGKQPEALQMIKAQAMLPHGEPGQLLLEELEEEFNEITAQLDIELPLLHQPVDIDLPLAVDELQWQLSGRLNHVYQSAGMLQISISKFNPGKLLPLWIEHLCMHACGRPTGTENAPADARLITPDNDIRLRTLSTESAREYLQQLIRLYQQGQTEPLNFIPKTSAAWAASWCSQGDEEKAFAESAKVWHGSYYYPGENEDFYNRIILRGFDWQPDEAFAEYAKLIFEPILAHMEPTA